MRSISLATWLPFSILAAVLLAGCRQQPEPVVPELSAPEKQASYLAPAAEVSASSGPVKLTLRLLKKTFKVGEGIWYQLELRNVGTAPMEVSSSMFLIQPGSYFYRNGLVQLELVGADGEPGVSGRDGVIESSHNPFFPPPPEPGRFFDLAPQASTTTTPWALPLRDGKSRRPVAQYTEFWESDFTGKRPLRIRAVYHRRWSAEVAKEMSRYGAQPETWNVNVETPWIVLEEER